MRSTDDAKLFPLCLELSYLNRAVLPVGFGWVAWGQARVQALALAETGGQLLEEGVGVTPNLSHGVAALDKPALAHQVEAGRLKEGDGSCFLPRGFGRATVGQLLSSSVDQLTVSDSRFPVFRSDDS